MKQDEYRKKFLDNVSFQGEAYAEDVLQSAFVHVTKEYGHYDKPEQAILIAAYVNAAGHFVSGSLSEPN